MPVFPEPKFPFSYTVATEVQRLRAHKASRGVPTRTANRLLVSTWNIARVHTRAAGVARHGIDSDNPPSMGEGVIQISR